jgi:hypothetical protein
MNYFLALYYLMLNLSNLSSQMLSTPSWARSTTAGRKPRRKLEIADHIVIDIIVLSQDFPIVIQEPHL